MTTNQITESLNALLMNIKPNGSQCFINEITTTSSPLLMKFSAPTEQLSSTGGKRSVRNILAERERDDFALSARMIAARKQLANEIHEITPENTFAKLRLIKGLSQQNVASMIGTSQSHIAKIEAGKVNIEFKTAIKIAKVLEITLDELKVLVEMSARPELHISVC